MCFDMCVCCDDMIKVHMVYLFSVYIMEYGGVDYVILCILGIYMFICGIVVSYITTLFTALLSIHRD